MHLLHCSFFFYAGMHFLNFVSCFSILGIPGLKASLLEEFGVRLLTYDLPGFGESDPHPNRNLETSAMDMLLLADAVGVNDKFWVVGYSSGSMHAWASLRYIPDRLAGMMSLLFYDISIRKALSCRHVLQRFPEDTWFFHRNVCSAIKYHHLCRFF